MKALHYIAFALIIIGGLNWLLFGLFQWEVGSLLGGPSAWLSRVVYILVGLAAVYALFAHKGSCRVCGMGSNSARPSAGSSRPEGSQEPAGGSSEE